MKYNTETFIENARIVHGNKYDYSKTKYARRRDKVIITCKKHGDFEQEAGSHLKGYNCNKCARETKINKEDLIVIFNEKFNNKFDYSKVDFKNYTKDKITIICKNHGEFKQVPFLHLNSKYGCPHCSYEEKGINKRTTQDDFIEKAKSIHGDKYNYSKVIYI